MVVISLPAERLAGSGPQNGQEVAAYAVAAARYSRAHTGSRSPRVLRKSACWIGGPGETSGEKRGRRRCCCRLSDAAVAGP